MPTIRSISAVGTRSLMVSSRSNSRRFVRSIPFHEFRLRSIDRHCERLPPARHADSADRRPRACRRPSPRKRFDPAAALPILALRKSCRIRRRESEFVDNAYTTREMAPAFVVIVFNTIFSAWSTTICSDRERIQMHGFTAIVIQNSFIPAARPSQSFDHPSIASRIACGLNGSIGSTTEIHTAHIRNTHTCGHRSAFTTISTSRTIACCAPAEASADTSPIAQIFHRERGIRRILFNPFDNLSVITESQWMLSGVTHSLNPGHTEFPQFGEIKLLAFMHPSHTSIDAVASRTVAR